MTGIQYITNESGERVEVKIDLRVHADLWEEIEDVLISEARSGETSVQLSQIKEALVASGRLRG